MFISAPLMTQSSGLCLLQEVVIKEKHMKVSARNVLKGTVKSVVTGAINDEVIVEVAPGVEVTAIITKTSAENLGLASGKEVYAVIKSSDVMIAVD